MQASEIVERLRQMPGWAGIDPELHPIDTGITNRNYRFAVDGAEFVVRIPGERTELLGIDRAGEQHAATTAAELGIGPAVRGELPGVGTLVTAFVPGAPADETTITAPGVLEAVVSAIAALHRSGSIAARFPIFRVVEWHARDAAANGVPPPPELARLQPVAAAIEAVFDPVELEATPCHNDLLPANVLLGEGRMWLIDYEYAGMNHAVFDLANLSVNCALDPSDDDRLLSAYYGAATDRDRARLALMKIMSEMREGMWAVVQQAISTLTHVDFVAYASGRLAHCLELAEHSDFADWLATARH
jgi:Ser/Thr protein kinase RdoA (MazF antagonist)